MAYELTARLLEAAHATIERVAVSQLKEEVFYATIWMRAGGATHEIDARPSDALNLALRLNAPILVAPEVMDGQGVQPDDLPAKLAKDQESIEGKIEWVSVRPPDLEMHKRPPQEK
jgi:bifunctional DNase/RNase